MFIDKYSQIYRILLPITTTLSQIPNLKNSPAIHGLIEEEFGSIDGLIKRNPRGLLPARIRWLWGG